MQKLIKSISKAITPLLGIILIHHTSILVIKILLLVVHIIVLVLEILVLEVLIVTKIVNVIYILIFNNKSFSFFHRYRLGFLASMCFHSFTHTLNFIIR